MADMSGLPVRLFYNDKNKKIFTNSLLIADPIELYKNELFSKTEHVSYFITPSTEFYGIINSKDFRIIVGPSPQSPFTDRKLHDLAFELNVLPKDFKTFSEAMKSIIPMPLDSILQMLCTLNHVINNEKLNLSDLQINETIRSVDLNYSEVLHESDIYKNYAIEQQISSIISTGDIAMLEKWVSEAPTVRAGTMANSFIRQNKNAFIVSCALFSRVAIDAGISPEDAFRMSDSYIQECENAQSIDEINNLNYRMVYDFTAEVNRKKRLTENTSLKSSIYFYVLHNISKPITTSDIANHLYMSRSYLSTTFKKTYGIDLNKYIHIIKIDKAKDLLKDHSKNITQISNYLGYSSSSHFNRIFKQITKTTPNEYRKTI